MPRTFQKLEQDDMQEVRRHAFLELDRFLNVAGTPPGKYSRYADRLLAICLAQGAAQHLIDLEVGAAAFDNEVRVSLLEIRDKGLCVSPTGRVISGIKDVDVLFFFREDEDLPLTNNRHLRKSVVANLGSLGKRRLDFMKKGMAESILAKAESDHPRDTTRAYLRESRHGRRYLARKSLIGLYPEAIFCQPVWRTRRLASGSI